MYMLYTRRDSRASDATCTSNRADKHGAPV